MHHSVSSSRPRQRHAPSGCSARRPAAPTRRIDGGRAGSWSSKEVVEFVRAPSNSLPRRSLPPSRPTSLALPYPAPPTCIRFSVEGVVAFSCPPSPSHPSRPPLLHLAVVPFESSTSPYPVFTRRRCNVSSAGEHGRGRRHRGGWSLGLGGLAVRPRVLLAVTLSMVAVRPSPFRTAPIVDLSCSPSPSSLRPPPTSAPERVRVVHRHVRSSRALPVPCVVVLQRFPRGRNISTAGEHGRGCRRRSRRGRSCCMEPCSQSSRNPLPLHWPSALFPSLHKTLTR